MVTIVSTTLARNLSVASAICPKVVKLRSARLLTLVGGHDDGEVNDAVRATLEGGVGGGDLWFEFASM
jgi:hypothetical protein